MNTFVIYNNPIFNTYDSENFDPVEAPKTEWEIREEKLKQERVEIILKNQNEVARRRLIRNYNGTEIIFRFRIKMITDYLINQQRHFIMMYYLDDTGLAIYEFRETNSGKFVCLKYYKNAYITVLNAH